MDIEKSQQKQKTNQNLILFLKSSQQQDERTIEIQKICKNNQFQVNQFQTAKEAIESYKQQQKEYSVIITALGIQKDNSDYWETLVKEIRTKNKQVFIIIFSTTACQNPKTRQICFNAQCNMVTECLDSLNVALKQIYTQIHSIGNLTCPYCQANQLTEDCLWVHLPLYHINEKNIEGKCPCCNHAVNNIQVHFRNSHGLVTKGLFHAENNQGIPLSAFSLMIVKRKSDGKYLLVQEFSGSGFWLPGGRVDPGESLQKAAIRECKEEAGIDIKLTGIITLQMYNKKDNCRMRIIFLAEPIDDNQKPKSLPDYESVGACYVTANQINDLQLRGNEPLQWIPYVENNGQIHPLSLFSKE